MYRTIDYAEHLVLIAIILILNIIIYTVLIIRHNQNVKLKHTKYLTLFNQHKTEDQKIDTTRILTQAGITITPDFYKTFTKRSGSA